MGKARAREWLLAAALTLAVVLAITWRLWTPIGARKSFGIDSQWDYWGLLRFQLDAYRAHELPLWNPFDRCGSPFFADPQAAVLYPITWLLCAVGWVAGGVQSWLIDVENVFHLWLAAFGMYVCLRRRGLAPFACVAGGLVLVLSSPFIHHLDLNLNWSMAWAPWLLAAIDAWSERPTAARASFVALAAGMSFLAGAMPTCWYTLLVAGPYAIWAIVHHARKGGRDYARRAAGSGALAVAILVALVAAQAVATGDLVGRTVRASRDTEFYLGTQFRAADLVGFAVPRMTRLNQYVGAGALLWIGAALALRPSARTALLGALALFGVLCGWGRNGGILPIAASWLPPFRLFRYAMRYTYVSIVPLGILAAEGLDTLARLEVAARRRAAGVLLAAGGVAVATFAIAFGTTRGPARIPYGMALGAFAVGTWATWLAVSCGDARKRLFGGLAVLVLAVDLFVGHVEAIERNLGPRAVTPRDGEVATLAGVEGHRVRLFDRAYLKFRPGIRLGVRDLGGYEGDPLDLSRYAMLLDAIEGRPHLAGHANVGWILEEAPKLLPADTALVRVRPGVYQVPDVAPAVVWIGRPSIAADDGAALRALLPTRPGSAAILERNSAPPEAASAASALPATAGEITVLGRNHLTATVDAPAAGVVVIAETFDPGWTATVDGRPATIFPANVLFRGVWVGPGAHTIELRYHARGFLWLALLELVGLAVAGVAIARGHARARRERTGDTA